MITTFRIHPEIESYIRKQSEEENRLLEESLLAEGCRDPLVVWEEENVLVDGHHRIAICRKHGLAYSVVYRSFPDIGSVKRWMRLNQLSRRNLDKDERERWIKELHEDGWTQAEIGEAVGVSQKTVSNTLSKNTKSQISQTDDSTTTQRLKDELARLRAEKDALAEKQRHEVEARARAEGDLLSVKNQLEFLRNKAKEEQPEPDRIERDKESLRNKLKEEQERHDTERKELIAELNAAKAKVKQAVPEVVEKVVEKPVVREVIREVVPEATQARLNDLEAQVRKTNANEQYLRNMEEKKFKLQSEIAALKEQATKDRVTANIEDAISFCQKERFVSTQVIEMAERGELTLEQIDMLLSVVGEISMESTKILNILQGLKSNFKKGGALRAL